mmetsp:Transcript_1727/g.4381  ORF Transcript_1727/g.4381 Transcript_1727/m.4381 type:complete len:316 (+) Transcript_1727:85-1032(+)
MRTHAARDHHGVWVHLQDPRMVAPTAVLDDDVPDVHEELGVARRAVYRPRDRRPRHVQGLDHIAIQRRADHRLVVRGQHGVLVAAEDASALAHGKEHQVLLIGRGLDQRPAENRRGALQGEAVAARAQRLASPRLVAVFQVPAGGAILQAHRPFVVLLVALRVGAEATLGRRATVALFGARRLDPRRHLRVCHGDGSRRSGARGVATPLGLPRPLPILARGALWLALRPILALLVALHAGAAAATLLAAILPVRGALLGHPGGGAGRPGAQLLASPRLAVRVRHVRTARDALGLASGPTVVLPEALRADLRAALG